MSKPANGRRRQRPKIEPRRRLREKEYVSASGTCAGKRLRPCVGKAAAPYEVHQHSRGTLGILARKKEAVEKLRKYSPETFQFESERAEFAAGEVQEEHGSQREYLTKPNHSAYRFLAALGMRDFCGVILNVEKRNEGSLHVARITVRCIMAATAARSSGRGKTVAAADKNA